MDVEIRKQESSRRRVKNWEDIPVGSFIYHHDSGPNGEIYGPFLKLKEDGFDDTIEAATIARLQRNLNDEKRILYDERAKRLADLLEGKVIQANLHDERTNKKLLSKGDTLSAESFNNLRSRDLKRMRIKGKDPHLNERIDEIEEMTIRQIQVLERLTDERIAKLKKGDELAPGVIKILNVKKIILEVAE